MTGFLIGLIGVVQIVTGIYLVIISNTVWQ